MPVTTLLDTLLLSLAKAYLYRKGAISGTRSHTKPAVHQPNVKTKMQMTANEAH